MVAKRILVIDNEEYIQEITQISLETVAGWEVLTASSGSEGLVKAESEQPDAILLDIMMPGIDGLTTFKELQANSTTRHIPVILLTAKVQAFDRRRYADLGMPIMITKPFDPLQLAHQIAEAMGWSL